jgi:uncharacterized protein with FMN-binding domain
MIIKTRIFELCNGSYRNLSELAQAMGISVSQIYRVRESKRSINQKFIVGAIKAFPKHKFEDLFYLAPEPLTSPPISVKVHIEKQALEKFTSVPL